MQTGRAVAVSLTLLAVAAVPAFAQRTTGTIAGTVADESGSILPGVTVELEGEAIVGKQTDVTNERGRYRFVALPPGRYDLEFTIAGFANVHHHDVRVPVGGTVEENAHLKLSQRSEEIVLAARRRWWTRPRTRSARTTTRIGCATPPSAASRSST